MKGFVTLTAILAVAMGIMFWMFTDGFAGKTAKGKAPPSQPAEEEDVNLPALPPIDEGQFGSDRVPPGQDAKPVPFDGKRAMKYLQSICDIGPRMSGTKGMAKQQELIKKHFEDLGFKVTYQTFKAKQNSVKGEI